MGYREVLGRHAWAVLHFEAARENAERVEKILGSYPCSTCRNHVAGIRERIPYYATVPRRRLALWVFHLHNRVNLDLGKRLLRLEDFLTIICEYPEKSIQFLNHNMG